jgi:elongation factor 1-alpha
MRKLQEEAEEQGKETFEFAFAMDNLQEERERGVTIDLRHKKFDTDKYEFTMIDAPGHRDFIKNMITGAAQADAGILVVAADDSVQPQTKEHSYLSKVLGIDQLVVAVNKMDVENYAEDRFEEVKEDVQDLLANVGVDTSDIKFIPVSAYEGDNIVEDSGEMDWYSGPTLYEALDDLERPDQPADLPLRVPIQDNYDIKGVGAVPVGRVETGVLNIGDDVVFEPASTRLNKSVGGEVKTIEQHHEEVDEADPGANIGFNVRGVGKDDVKRGDVAGHSDDTPTVVDEFKAQIIVLDHPNVVTEGYTPVFHVNTAQVACTFTEVHKTLDPKSGEVKDEDPDYIQTGESAVVTLKPQKPLVIEQNDEIPQMARFAIRDMDRTVGAGMCIDLTEK